MMNKEKGDELIHPLLLDYFRFIWFLPLLHGCCDP